MIKLYGLALMPGHPDEEVLVATFSDEDKARKYVNQSRLKRPTRYTAFKSSSLLGGYYDCYVDDQSDDEVPHDPI